MRLFFLLASLFFRLSFTFLRVIANTSALLEDRSFRLAENPNVFTVFHSAVRAPRGECTPHSNTWIVDQLGRSDSPVRVVFATTTRALGVNFRGFNVALCLETPV